ncbi:hypothetical protein [Crossiella sp. SN42]|nr:hypothetical protein [Crossiella sp. SN42]
MASALTKRRPALFAVLAGNAKATGPSESIARWSCLHAGVPG